MNNKEFSTQPVGQGKPSKDISLLVRKKEKLAEGMEEEKNTPGKENHTCLYKSVV